MSDVTRSCPICDQAPTWKDAPDKPGLWLRRQWWKDDGKPYDGDQLREFVVDATGLMLRTYDGKLYPFSIFDDTHSVSMSLWFGPIPSPVRSAIPQAPNGGEGEK